MDPVRKISLTKVEKTTSETYKTYKRRWVMLFIFSALYFTNTAQWVQYTIIGNIIKKYYNISSIMVNMTSVVYLLPYLPLIVPASYVTNKKVI